MLIGKRLAATCTVLACLCGLGSAASVGAASAASPVVISPLAGTVSAMPQTEISFLGASASALSKITVVGSVSGRHSGRLRAYAAATGASFKPSKPFTGGEQVTVRATLRTATGKLTKLSSAFTVAQPVAVPIGEFPTIPGTPADVQNFNSQPEFHPPAVVVHQAASGASSPGYVFAAPFLGPGQWGPMIFDSAGNLVWFHQVAPGQDAADFRTQVYRGKTDLTWWQGRTIQLGYGLGEDIIADSSYRTVAVIKAGNGLQADEHEFNVTPQGTAWILAYSPVQASLASAGGAPNGVAVDGVIQEIDIKTGQVMWEWHSLGHVDVSESYSKAPASATAPYDYFHINSLSTDRRGHLLVSARNTWTIYDINPATGAIAWRLGGKKSTFTLGPGVQFAYQHNATWLPNGDLSLFDDEGAPPVNPPSRGEIIKIDKHARTATLVSQFVRTIGPLSTGSQGDLQSLPGGGWMIGWGGLPNFTEFDAQGHVIYDATLPKGEFSYRIYRLPWSGLPTYPPSATAHKGPTTSTVYASWNGATGIASWQLLTGSTASQMTPVSTTPSGGFETTIPAPSAAYYQVRALNGAGKVLGTSKVLLPTTG